MFTISKAVIDTYIVQKDRDSVNYLVEVVNKMKAENPALFTSILESAQSCSRNILSTRKTRKVSDEEFRRSIEMNILLYCMSVYHCIGMQAEVNELNEQFGETNV